MTSVAEMNARKAVIRAAGGRTSGPPPYGNRLLKPGVMVEEPDEQVGLALMHRQAALGWSFERIARTLDALEFSPRKGQRWSRNSVRALVLGERGRSRTG